MKPTKTITRRIEIYVNEPYSELRKSYYKRLRDYSYISRNYANDTMNLLQSIRFIESMNQLSNTNSKALKDLIGKKPISVGYNIFIKKYENILPSQIRSCINNLVYSKFSKTIKDVLRGDVTVTSYKKNYPVFFDKLAIRKLENVNNDIIFNFLSIPLKFNFGRDRSNNRSIVNKIINGEYKLCNSSFMFKDNKLFINLVCKIPENKHELNESNVLGVDLGINNPAYVAINNDENFRQSICNRESFLNRRLGLQKQKRQLQKDLKYTKGGRGGKKKLKKLDDIGNKERNFIKTMNHTISKEIINLAIRNKCGAINIEDLSSISKNTKNSFILRNWSYHELQSMIEYKADINGIKVNKIKPNYTSQRCHKCGHIHSENRLTQSDFVCLNCGYEDNADYNAAKNISVAHTKEYIKEIDNHMKKKEEKLCT